MRVRDGGTMDETQRPRELSPSAREEASDPSASAIAQDATFSAAMRRAIEKGLENAPIGIDRRPGTKRPILILAGWAWAHASPSAGQHHRPQRRRGRRMNNKAKLQEAVMAQTGVTEVQSIALFCRGTMKRPGDRRERIELAKEDWKTGKFAATKNHRLGCFRHKTPSVSYGLPLHDVQSISSEAPTQSSPPPSPSPSVHERLIP
jgi:hypothetical protein